MATNAIDLKNGTPLSQADVQRRADEQQGGKYNLLNHPKAIGALVLSTAVTMAAMGPTYKAGQKIGDRLFPARALPTATAPEVSAERRQLETIPNRVVVTVGDGEVAGQVAKRVDPGAFDGFHPAEATALTEDVQGQGVGPGHELWKGQDAVVPAVPGQVAPQYQDLVRPEGQ